MAQPSGHDFCYRKTSIGKALESAWHGFSVARELAPAGLRSKPKRFYDRFAVEREQAPSPQRTKPHSSCIKYYVYNFLYLTGTISWFFENIPCLAVTAMRHGVAERRN
jgi:hypothetical protein